MASLRNHLGNLFFDFRAKGERCREYTQLPDTAANRAAAQKKLDKLVREIKLGTFNYTVTFPSSPRGWKAAAQAATVLNPAVATIEPAVAPSNHTQVVNPAGLGAAKSSSGIPIVSKFAEVWFSEAKVAWRATYEQTVRDILDQHVFPQLGNLRIKEVTRADLLNFRAGVAAKRGKKEGSTLSPARINTIMLITKQVLEEAADRYDFTCPFVRIKPLKVPKSDVKPFTMDEVKKILDTVRKDFRTYFLVRFFTGMRTGEVDGLKWKFVDFEARQILIRETIVRGEEEYTKNDASQREIKMTNMVFDTLQEHRKVTQHLSEYVFCTPSGQPYDNRNVTKRVWYPLLRYLNIPGRRPYQTRHTAATMWLAAGENPEWIARQMGHANTEMLFTVYSRYVPNLTRRDGSAIEKMISPLFEPDAANDATSNPLTLVVPANDVPASENSPQSTQRNTNRKGGKKT